MSKLAQPDVKTFVTLWGSGQQNQQQRRKYNIKLIKNEGPILECSLGKAQRGGQHMGKRHRIRELYVDSENRILAGFESKDRYCHSQGYQYEMIGRLEVIYDKEEA